MRTAGSVWRVNPPPQSGSPFDELVVAPRWGIAWLHVEMLDDWHAFIAVGERALWVEIDTNGLALIIHEETRSYDAATTCPACDRAPRHWHQQDGEPYPILECSCGVTWSRHRSEEHDGGGGR